MKRLLGLLFLVMGLVFSAALVHADSAQPILMVNGAYVIPPLDPQTTEGQDVPSLGPAIYQPGQKLQFAIDLDRLGTPQNILKKTTFTWEFGDGTQAYKDVDVLQKSHTYANAGLYKVTVTADYRTAGYTDISPQVIAIADISVDQLSTTTPVTPVVTAPGGTVLTPSGTPVQAKPVSVWKRLDFVAIAKYSLFTGLFLTILFSILVRTLTV